MKICGINTENIVFSSRAEGEESLLDLVQLWQQL